MLHRRRRRGMYWCWLLFLSWDDSVPAVENIGEQSKAEADQQVIESWGSGYMYCLQSKETKSFHCLSLSAGMAEHGRGEGHDSEPEVRKDEIEKQMVGRIAFK